MSESYQTVYQCDADGWLVGPSRARESPEEPGVYLIPAGCVDVPPPALDEGARARWTGANWELVAPPPAPPDELDVERSADELAARTLYRRRAAEAAGVSMGGHTFASDLEAQARITATLTFLERSGEPVARWKSWGGRVDLSPAELEALGLLVAQHVERCFGVEEAVETAIAAGTIHTWRDVDAAFAAQMEG